eukprot:COSAG02_NODE_51324_length_314_cov_2450.809302_2_plen_37_part_01
MELCNLQAAVVGRTGSEAAALVRTGWAEAAAALGRTG